MAQHKIELHVAVTVEADTVQQAEEIADAYVGDALQEFETDRSEHVEDVWASLPQEVDA